MLLGQFCYVVDPAFRDTEGFIPLMVFENHPKQFVLNEKVTRSATWHWGRTFHEAVARCATENAKRGLSMEDTDRIVLSSMKAHLREQQMGLAS